MGIKRYHDRLLRHISDDLRETACDRHRHELERLGHRAEAAGRLGKMLADLKYRIARKTAVRGRYRMAIPRIEAPSQAA